MPWSSKNQNSIILSKARGRGEGGKNILQPEVVVHNFFGWNNTKWLCAKISKYSIFSDNMSHMKLSKIQSNMDGQIYWYKTSFYQSPCLKGGYHPWVCLYHKSISWYFIKPLPLERFYKIRRELGNSDLPNNYLYLNELMILCFCAHIWLKIMP